MQLSRPQQRKSQAGVSANVSKRATLQLQCLFTKHLIKKRKTWQDGILKIVIDVAAANCSLMDDSGSGKALDGKPLQGWELGKIRDREECTFELENYIVTIEADSYASQGGRSETTKATLPIKPPLKLPKFVPPSMVSRPASATVLSKQNTENPKDTLNTWKPSRGHYSIEDDDLDDIWDCPTVSSRIAGRDKGKEGSSAADCRSAASVNYQRANESFHDSGSGRRSAGIATNGSICDATNTTSGRSDRISRGDGNSENEQYGSSRGRNDSGGHNSYINLNNSKGHKNGASKFPNKSVHKLTAAEKVKYIQPDQHSQQSERDHLVTGGSTENSLYVTTCVASVPPGVDIVSGMSSSGASSGFGGSHTRSGPHVALDSPSALQDTEERTRRGGYGDCGHRSDYDGRTYGRRVDDENAGRFDGRSSGHGKRDSNNDGNNHRYVNDKERRVQSSPHLDCPEEDSFDGGHSYPYSRTHYSHNADSVNPCTSSSQNSRGDINGFTGTDPGTDSACGVGDGDGDGVNSGHFQDRAYESVDASIWD